MCTAQLSEDEFTRGGATYTVKKLYWNSHDGSLILDLSRGTTDIGGATIKSLFSVLVLVVDGVPFNLRDASTTNAQVYWSFRPDPTWTEGQDVKVSLVLPSPRAPTGLGVTPGNAKLDLSWTAVFRAAGYDVHYTASTSVDDDADVGGAVATAWVEASHTGETASGEITGLTNATAYRVRAKNAGGNSPWAFGSGTPKASTSGSTDATLSALSMTDNSTARDAIAFAETFSSTTYVYTANVPASRDQVRVTPTVTESNATVKVGMGSNLADVASGSESDEIDLAYGANRITVEVTAQAGNKRSYTIVVTRTQLSEVEWETSTLSAGEGGGDIQPRLGPETIAALTGPVTYAPGATNPATLADDLGTLPTTFTTTTANRLTSVVVPITDDTLNEEDETFTVTIGPGTGYSVGSESVLTVTIKDNDPPAAPGSLALTAGDAQLDVSWAKPAGPVTGYQVRHKTTAAADQAATTTGDPTTGWVTATPTGTGTTATISSLTNDTSYDVQVRATDGQAAAGNGYGPWTATQSGSPTNLPAAPMNLVVTRGDTKLDLSWTAPSGTVTGYDVHYTSALKTGASAVDDDATVTTGAASAGWVDASHTGTTASGEITGLTNSTLYRVRVRAVNDNGSSDWLHGTGTPLQTINATLSASPNPVSAGSDVTLTATLSAAAPADSLVNLNFAQGTAHPSRYGEIGSIFIASGQTSGTSTVAIQATTGLRRPSDKLGTFTVSISGFSGGAIGRLQAGNPSSVEITILDYVAPPNLDATPGNGRLDLSWTAPSGSVAPTGYDVHYTASTSVADDAAVGSAVATQWVDAGHTGTATSQTIRSLTNDTTYRVRVRAKNDYDVGLWAHGTGTLPPTPPANLLLGPDVGKLDLTWTAPSGVTVTGYDVHYTSAALSAVADDATVTTGAASAGWVDASHTGTTASGEITDLTAGTTYRVRVRAVTANGSSAWLHGTGMPLTNPGVPTNLMVTAGPLRLDVSFDAAPNAATPYIHYVRWRVKDTAPGTQGDQPGDWKPTVSGIWLGTARTETSGTLPPATCQNCDPLTAGIVYEVQARARNFNSNASVSVDGDWSASAEGTPDVAPPSVPQDVQVTPGDTKLDLSWKVPLGTVTGYDVHYTSAAAADLDDSADVGTTVASEWVDASHTGTTASAEITGLTNDTPHRVRVRAVNAHGSSDWVFVTGTPSTPVVGFSSATYTVTEGLDTSVTITLTIVPPLAAAGSAVVAARSGHSDHTAGPDDDSNYVLPASVALPAEAATATFVVTIPDNELAEITKTLVMGLEPPAAGQAWTAAGSRSEARLEINDNDIVTVSFQPDMYTVAEGGSVALTVVLDRDIEVPVTVTLFSQADSDTNTADATAETDYVIEGTTVTFPAGQRTPVAAPRIRTVADSVSDDDETFLVRMRKGPTTVRVEIGPDPATVTIGAQSAVAPAAPTGLTVAPGDGRLDLSWTPPAETVTGYDVHYTSAAVGTVANDATVTTGMASAGWVDAGHTGTTASDEITGLTNSLYRVRVRAVNAHGSSDWAFGTGTPAASTTPVTGTAWSATLNPVEGNAGSIGCFTGLANNKRCTSTAVLDDNDFEYNSVTYTMVRISDQADGRLFLNFNATGIRKAVFSGLNFCVDTTAFAFSDSVSTDQSGESRFVWSGASLDWAVGTPVSLSIGTSCQAGTPAEVTPPSNLVVTPGNSELILSWTASSGTVDGYIVNYTASTTVADDAALGVNPATEWVVAPSPITTATSFTIPGLANGTVYRVRVSAFRGTDFSAPAFGTGTPTASAARTAPWRSRPVSRRTRRVTRRRWRMPSRT